MPWIDQNKHHEKTKNLSLLTNKSKLPLIFALGSQIYKGFSAKYLDNDWILVPFHLIRSELHIRWDPISFTRTTWFFAKQMRKTDLDMYCWFIFIKKTPFLFLSMSLVTSIQFSSNLVRNCQISLKYSIFTGS